MSIACKFYRLLEAKKNLLQREFKTMHYTEQNVAETANWLPNICSHFRIIESLLENYLAFLIMP